MDVTPRELRDAEIREAFRGYNREDTDDLLERAAKTLEAANDRIRQLTEQVQAGGSEAGKSRELEETLQRTLILAQRTADQAIAEAQEQSKTMVDEAERKARTITTEAETQAKRAAETERQRLESEILDLGARRDALVADVDALERFDADYRTRLRGAIESDLEWLSKRSAVPAARPAIHDVALPGQSRSPAPVSAAAVAPPAVPEPAVAPSPEAGVAPPAEPEESGPAPGGPSSGRWSPPAPAGGAEPGEPTANADANPERNAATATASPSGSATGPASFAPEAPVESQVLDDDAFFASLREAVRDDAPLGPREEDPKGGSLFAPAEEDTRFGSVFKRRR
ncbi:MAG: DivIVA domain-containing protein [Acidimicrobiia bacterium]